MLCGRTQEEGAAIKYITTETLSPRAGGSFSSRAEMIQGIRAMFSSHGQGVRDSLRNRSHTGESIVLIDSPETGQDHENCLLIHQGLIEMATQYQVIIATNSLVFMRGGHLIDLGQDYLANLIQATGALLSDREFHADVSKRS
jgi:predicted ATPase